MAKFEVKQFPKKHPIIFNLLLIFVVFLIICNIVLFLLDIFTEHNKFHKVPYVNNMYLGEAVAKLESEDFKWEVVDSIYSDNFNHGAVVEQVPKENSKVKSNRTIFLTINAFTPRLISFPNIVEVSERQGNSRLVSLGFKNINIKTVSSPYNGLILDCTINGEHVNPGTKVPSSSNITIIVGDGGTEVLSVDSLNMEETEPVNLAE